MKGFVVPKHIMLMDGLSVQDKYLLSFIISHEEGCSEKNDMIGQICSISKDRVSKVLSEMQKRGLIKVSFDTTNGARILCGGVGENNYGGVGENNQGGGRRKQLPPIGENNYPPPSEFPDLPINTVIVYNKRKVVRATSKPKNEKAKTGKIKNKKQEFSVDHWFVKQRTIFLGSNKPLIMQPLKDQVLKDILSSKLPAGEDSETAAFLKEPQNEITYNQMLQAYGIARTFMQEISAIRSPEQYKAIREADVAKWIDEARLMLQVDKRNPVKVKEVMDFMFDEDTFWKNTIFSLTSFRKHFDTIMGKMDSVRKKESDNQFKPNFKVTG